MYASMLQELRSRTYSSVKQLLAALGFYKDESETRVSLFGLKRSSLKGFDKRVWSKPMHAGTNGVQQKLLQKKSTGLHNVTS